MSSFARFHDGVFLRFLQEDFYEYQALWMAVMFVLLVCLPAHRISSRIVAWFGVLWALLCILFYGALVEAPWLGWFLVAVLGYRLARWLLWTLPASVTLKKALNRLGWLRIPGGWTTAVLREYLRADPRAVYWLDLARAVRGLPMRRSGADRRAALVPTAELPDWRRRAWRLFFRLVELRIWIYRRLPRYWHWPHTRLDLGEEHLSYVIEQESERTYQKMLRSWTGDDFTEYCNRDPKTRKREERRAAMYGQTSCLLREALAEYRTLREPWQPGEQLLLDAAVLSYLTWRRRQHAVLWHPDSDKKGVSAEPEPQDAVPQPVENSAETEPAENSTEDSADLGVVVKLDEDSASELTDGSSKASPASAEPVEPQSEDQTAPVDGEDAADEGGPLEDRFAIAKELLGASSEQAEPEEDQYDMSDDQLFDVAAPEAPDEAAHEVAADNGRRTVKLSSREEEQLANLQTASRMLEAFLGVEASGDFSADVEQVERFLGHPKRRLAAAMLLMFYCLRTDFGGADVDGQKVELLARLDEQLFSRSAAGQQSAAERRLLLSMQIDVMFHRREYSRVVEFFSRYDDLGKYECQVLASAETALAQHLTGQDELRDMLRYDAICHYFRAGFRGIWTPEYASRLVDQLSSADELLDLFHEHPVEIGRPASLAPPPSRQTPAKPAPPPSRQKDISPPPLKRMVRVRLAAAASPSKGRLLPIDKLPCTLGRTQQASICLTGMDVADVHVAMEDREGVLVVKDVSGQGLRVNAKQVKAAKLKKGDLVQFGNVIMKIEDL